MLDLIIRGGQVVAPHGVGTWDVATVGEKIVALAVPGTRTEDAVRIVDAEGKIVVPGGIDPHNHCNWPLPAPEGGTPGQSAGPLQVSRAALFGGTTTLLDFALWQQGDTIEQTIDRDERDWQGQSYCDYAHHVMLQ